MMKRPEDGLPEDIREHMRLMCDIVRARLSKPTKPALATLLLNRDLSGLFSSIPRRTQLTHHPASHDDKSEAYEKISRYYCSQFAYLAGRLDAMKEGDSTVLDNSCLMFISSMWSGTKHDSSKVPLLLAGGLGGTLKTGRVLNYRDKSDESRKLCSLYLSLMDRMDVRLDRFGDSDVRLAGI